MNNRHRQKLKAMYGPLIRMKDLYSLDIAIAKYAAQGLEKFYNYGLKGKWFGIPQDYMAEYNDDEKEALEAWLADIKKMQKAFENYVYFFYNIEACDKQKFKEIKDGMQLFIDHFENLWI